MTIDNIMTTFVKRKKKMTELSTFSKNNCQNIREPQWKCRTFAESKGTDPPPTPPVREGRGLREVGMT